MPKKSRKEKKLKSNSSLVSDALTLNHYANNTHLIPGQARGKKGIFNCKSATAAVSSQGQDSHHHSIAQEEKDWFEKDLDDFDDIDAVNDFDEEDCLPQRAKTRRKKKSTGRLGATEDSGIVYPYDLWSILSVYIRPEDIGRFSQLCKFSYEVTQFSSYWRKLYRRYYTHLKVLPVRLQPESLERLYELRTCVIRSLFYLYPGYIARLRGNKECEPGELLKRTCISFWHQKSHGMFQYFFKLQENDHGDSTGYHHKSLKGLKEEDLIDALGNINANSQYGSRVLEVTCTTFSSVPSTVFGQTLLATSSALSSDFRTYNLRLVFGSLHVLGYKKTINFSTLPEGSIGISLNSVLRVKILDWWHPSYPNPNTLPQSDSETSTSVLDQYF